MKWALFLNFSILFLIASCGRAAFDITVSSNVARKTCQNKQSFFYYSKSNLNGEWDQAPNLADNIWRMSDDGQERIAITKNSLTGLGSIYPSVSSDQKFVAFQSFTAIDGSWDGTPSLSSNIWIMDIKGENLRKLTSNTNASLDSSFPHISPDGNWVLFLSKMDITGVTNGTTSNSINLWVAAMDGSSKRAITKNTNGGYDCSFPKFSPDSKKIVFACKTALNGAWNGAATPNTNIWIASIADDSILPLTSNTIAALKSNVPQFSPDNLKIVYTSNMNLSGVTNAAAAADNIWIMNIDGSNKVPLTQNTIASIPSTNPWLSPDGSKLTFQSKKTLDGIWNSGVVANYNLWIMNVDGSEMKPITKNIVTAPIAVHGVFSPDGKSLIYRSTENLSGNFDDPLNLSLNIWHYNFSDETREAMTKNTNIGLNSEILPNSSWISECVY